MNPEIGPILIFFIIGVVIVYTLNQIFLAVKELTSFMREVPVILDCILDALDRIEQKLSPVKSGGSIKFFKTVNGQKVRFTMDNMPVSDKAVLSLEIDDSFGNLAQVVGAPSWSLSDPSLGQLSVAADGMSAEFLPGGKVGQIDFMVDADPGQGGDHLKGSASLMLVAGVASQMKIKEVSVPLQPIPAPVPAPDPVPPVQPAKA